MTLATFNKAQFLIASLSGTQLFAVAVMVLGILFGLIWIASGRKRDEQARRDRGIILEADFKDDSEHA